MTCHSSFREGFLRYANVIVFFEMFSFLKCASVTVFFVIFFLPDF